MAITMAGRGARFAAVGYDMPKYEIKVRGRTLFDWSMDGLSTFCEAGWRFRFAMRGGVGARPFLEARCAALGITIDGIVELDAVTDGQATTARMLAREAPATAPFAVFNIDTHLRPGAIRPWNPRDCDGIVPCFPGEGAAWSFARLDANGYAIELREKVRISDHASVGFYGFASAATFMDGYRDHFLDGHGEEGGERYIAPMYNALIAVGARIGVPLLERSDVTGLGTPEEVAAFEATRSPDS